MTVYWAKSEHRKYDCLDYKVIALLVNKQFEKIKITIGQNKTASLLVWKAIAYLESTSNTHKQTNKHIKSNQHIFQIIQFSKKQIKIK